MGKLSFVTDRIKDMKNLAKEKMGLIKKGGVRYDAMGNVIGYGNATPKGGAVKKEDKKYAELMKKWAKGKANSMNPLQVDDSGNVKLGRPSISAGSILVIVVLIGVAIFGMFLTGDQYVTSFLGSVGLYKTFQGAQTSFADFGSYTSCLLENKGKFRFGDPSADEFGGFVTGGIFEICAEENVNAESLGCDECFTFTTEAQNSVIFAGTQDVVVFANIRLEDQGEDADKFEYIDIHTGKQVQQELTPAADPKIEIFTEGGQNAKISADPPLGEELDPGYLKTNEIFVQGVFDGSSYCTADFDSVQPTVTLSYTYRTEGSAPINIIKLDKGKPVEGNFQERAPITLPGPVKVDIIPSSYSSSGSRSYSAGLSKTAFVKIKFRNVGDGDALVKNLVLKQITPEGASPLRLTEDGCKGPVSETVDGGSEVKVNLLSGAFVLGEGQKTASIVCSFHLPPESSLKSDFTTYILTGAATYEYQLEREMSTVILKKDFCGQPGTTKTSTTTAPTTSGDTTKVVTGGVPTGGSA